MKKYAIALVALASIGSAFGADPSAVTIYGKVDIGLKSSTTTGGVDQGLVPATGSYEGDRIGFKGETDIGAGLKAGFQLEGAFGGDGTLAKANMLFSRVTKGYIAGSFGTVSAGKDWSPYDSAFNDSLEYNGFSAMGNAWYAGAHGDNGTTGGGNPANALQYATPDFGGFNAVVMYAPGQDKTSTTDATSYTGLGLNYVKGPVAINFAYETKKNYQNAVVVQGVTTNAWILATSYDLGVAKVFAGAEQADTGSTGKDSGYELGLSVPVTKEIMLGLGYATETTQVSGQTDGKATSFGLQAVYTLTPKAAFYAGYNTTDTTPSLTQVKSTTSYYATGFRYNF